MKKECFRELEERLDSITTMEAAFTKDTLGSRKANTKITSSKGGEERCTLVTPASTTESES